MSVSEIPAEFADLVSFAIASQESQQAQVAFARAAALIRSADALLISAGAGMGVDSGLPDFRGPEGFWRAYPAFRGKQFHEMSNPRWFVDDPKLAWGFFGHRMNLYRAAVPHGGYTILRKWAETRPSFVFTSNVDGQFLKAGFDADALVECHGTITMLQCVDSACVQELWPTADLVVDVDPDTIRATSPLPTCPTCGKLARPNILMFGDGTWRDERTSEQEARLNAWLAQHRGKRIVAVEMGAGLAVPTVRMTSEQLSDALVRINPREPEVPRDADDVGLPHGAFHALTEIDKLLGAL